MPRAAANQPGLFDAPAPTYEPPPTDPAFARKHMNWLLRTAERAESLPWTPAKTQMWETLFHQVSVALPPDEAQDLCEAFTKELIRLRAATP